MAYQRYLIADFKTGLDKYDQPWLMPNDAYQELHNAFLYRGVLVKRDGYSSIGSLGSGPTMGLRTRITQSGISELIAFNQTKAYVSTSGGFSDISGATSWTGSNSDFFWSDNYYNAFWVTNNVDPLRYYLGGSTWTDFKPVVSGTTQMEKALLVVAYKDRMIALNTTEGGLLFQNRARWSQNGSPFISSPTPSGVGFDVDAWRDDIVGRGGYIDAPTQESIISCSFNKDLLIVFFSQSTWKLRYTGNELLPFTWERVNSTMGSDSTFSAVNFDEGILAVSRRGIIAGDAINVKRIDERIPDLAFEFNIDNEGLKRIHGIRDYQRQLAYWTYVDSATGTQIYPNRILCINYLEGSWATFTPTNAITCFGQFTNVDDDVWQDIHTEWKDYEVEWNSGVTQSGYPFVVGGDVDGNVWQFDETASDGGTDFEFTVTSKQFNPFIEQGYKVNLGYVDFLVRPTNGGKFLLEIFADNDNSSPILTTEVEVQESVNSLQWVRAYVNSIAQFHTLRLSHSTALLTSSPGIARHLEIQGMILYMKPAAMRII